MEGLSGKEGAAFLKMAEEVDAVRIARVLKVRWSQDNKDAYMWSVNECHHCDSEMHEGEIGFVWGKGVTDDRDCQYVTLISYCSEPCVGEAVQEWAEEIESDVMTGYFTDEI